MQRGENEAENDEQQNEMKDLAHALQNSPDKCKKTHQTLPDSQSMPLKEASMPDDGGRQIFSSMRAALPDRSRR